MATLSLPAMHGYLASSISSLNPNKLNGLLAEIELRNHLAALGYGDRVSAGGWIARREGAGQFGHHTVVLFPETIVPGRRYDADRQPPEPSHGLLTICATFHQSGIASYYCSATVPADDEAAGVTWRTVQLGLPTPQPHQVFPDSIENFRRRAHRYGFLRYHTDTARIPDLQVPEEYSKEHLRVTFSDRFLAEISDLDGIFWGQQYTYPLEIKEKTAATDRAVGDYFGLDLGPFVKLAFYAAKRGNLHSLFIVREIDNVETRGLVGWWFITFDRLAQFASWIPMGGGTNMMGGRSTVVRIPKQEFRPLDAANLAAL
jgi:hypothetical protein